VASLLLMRSDMAYINEYDDDDKQHDVGQFAEFS